MQFINHGNRHLLFLIYLIEKILMTFLKTQSSRFWGDGRYVDFLFLSISLFPLWRWEKTSRAPLKRLTPEKCQETILPCSVCTSCKQSRLPSALCPGLFSSTFGWQTILGNIVSPFIANETGCPESLLIRPPKNAHWEGYLPLLCTKGVLENQLSHFGQGKI